MFSHTALGAFSLVGLLLVVLIISILFTKELQTTTTSQNSVTEVATTTGLMKSSTDSAREVENAAKIYNRSIQNVSQE